MKRSDQLDKVHARRFAWRFVRNGETVNLSESARSAKSAEAEPPAQTEAMRAHAREVCAQLATAIDAAWALIDPERQARVTRQIVMQASSLGYELAAIDEQPLQSIRLARLFTRHFCRLSLAARQAATEASFWLDYDHPECAELLVEVAQAGLSEIGDAIRLSWEEVPIAGAADAADRLARLARSGARWDTRAIALEFLEGLDTPEVVAALRRCVRQPSLAVRSRALQQLVALGSPALAADDVLFLLEDAVKHPIDAGNDSDDVEAPAYAASLVEAVGLLRPAEGARWLLRALEHDASGEQAPTWALEALAAGYAALACGHIDGRLSYADTARRAEAVRAIARLPDDLAKARWLRAAADAAPEIAQAAKERWLERFATLCPVDATAGVPNELLQGPPSERFLSRLGVLRGTSRGARATMCSVLLGEAPDPESLALIVFALGDSSAWRFHNGRRRGEGVLGWARVIVSRFGRHGVRGICWLAERFPKSTGAGWLDVLRKLVEQKAIRRGDWDLVSATATRRFSAGESAAHEAANRTLALVGAPSELFDVLWSMGIDQTVEGRSLDDALPLLSSWRDGGELNARIAAQIDQALADNDLRRLTRVVTVAAHRGMRHAPAFVERALERPAEHVDPDTLERLAALVESHTGVRERWLRGALSRPESLQFAVALRVSSLDVTGANRKALELALASEARDGAAAAEALSVLLRRAKGFRSSDPRIPGVLDRAPLLQQADLISDLLARRAPVRILRDPLARVLASTDPRVVGRASTLIWLMRSTIAKACLRAMLPLIVDLSLREHVSRHLSGTRPEPLYWQPAGSAPTDEADQRRPTSTTVQ